MSPDGAGWHDPFAEDEEAIARERRRAEREARRRGVQSSLGEKVSAGRPSTDEQPAAPAPDPPSNPTTADRPAPPDDPPPAANPTASKPAVSRGGVPPTQLWVRRIAGVVVLLAAVALVVFVAAKVIDRIGGSDYHPEKLAQAPTSEITVPEGLDRRQIADLAKESGIKGDYMEATKKPPKNSGFDLASYDAQDAPNLEGFLFPDTWNDLPKQPTVRDLVDRQLADFQQQIKQVDMDYAESKNLTVYDVVKIASIIEKEIAVPEERKLAAAVIYNRLSAGEPLGMDSTIRYYLQNFDQPLTESELAEDQPYNSRIRAGLPPTPISNPGLASLEAAANPAKSDAFYFVIKPGTCNEHTFVATEEEFQQAEAEYQQALEEQGGSPTEC
jgi:cell division protein YceG involved in septum cleavage